MLLMLKMEVVYGPASEVGSEDFSAIGNFIFWKCKDRLDHTAPSETLHKRIQITTIYRWLLMLVMLMMVQV